MENYWESRYKSGGNSGSGSYGESANHKAEIINNYISKFNIKTISDFGCGDGNQIGLLTGYDKYTGYDISLHILNVCREKFKNTNMSFCSLMTELPEADLCISLDVIYHILDNDDYETYMKMLFDKSKKFVLIFSSNHNNNNHDTKHIRHHKFSDWIEKYRTEFKLIEEIDNFLLTSAKFYLFEKKN